VPLEAGEPIKIAVREPYRRARERPESDPERRGRPAGVAIDPAEELGPTSLRAN